LSPVPVLAYHSVGDARRGGTLRWSVSAGDFDEQMALLVRLGRTPLTVSRYADLLRGGGPLPPRPVLVTFDDGYPDLATAALPVLLRYGIPATAYLITSRVGVPPAPGADPAVDWDQVAELRRAGLEIGSHSHTHRELDCLGPAQLYHETAVSRRVLEERLAEPVSSFAYPYGYHSRAVRRAVRGAGYTCACAVKNVLSHPGDDLFALARVLVERDTGVAGIAAVMDGQGWPVASGGERLRTRGWRAYRRARSLVTGARRPAHRPAPGCEPR
jgi:peptidoglycan/xylan/chitin deacetylase (PgdA/CDA1 family)